MARKRKCDCGTCKRCKHREYMLGWYRRNRDKACETARTTRQRHLETIQAAGRERGYRPGEKQKRAARAAVANAITHGALTRQPCETCGAKQNVQAHHDDYSKPLEVRWLCPRHHGIVHRHPIQEEAA